MNKSVLEKNFISGWNNSIVGRAFVFQVVNPGRLPGIPYGSLRIFTVSSES